jgi:hypothetical protein
MTPKNIELVRISFKLYQANGLPKRIETGMVEMNTSDPRKISPKWSHLPRNRANSTPKEQSKYNGA